MCDVVTVLETHNKQPEDSLQQNRYIYLLCVIMTSHTAYPVGDFAYKRCCINLTTKKCARGLQDEAVPEAGLAEALPQGQGLRGVRSLELPGAATHGSRIRPPLLQLGMQGGTSLCTEIKGEYDWFLLTSF